ncbi:polycomb group medea [Fusarium albosuccineum]|uniref:Polycomb group medea n=1 Tax=Fusarium albosuccineum TaxID=1237068 RepID=A0A8H4LD46_9HYPO|nr:polycomb group medea [Fusarium albosuccineum]
MAPDIDHVRRVESIDHIDLTLESSDSEGHPSRYSRPSQPTIRAETTSARFDLDPFAGRPPLGNIHHGASRAPISPPRLKRPPTISSGQGSHLSFDPARQAAPAIRLGPKAPTSNPGTDNAPDMARLSGVGAPNPGPRQVTPPFEHHPPKPSPQVKATPPKYQTPRKPEWDVAGIARALNTFRQDIKDGHARMTSYIIESTKPIERRVLTGKDLFAGLGSKPVQSEKDETMRIKFKEHTKLKNNKREDHYRVVRIQTDEERVPRYRFHHVEIKKNILTPNTMLTFVPHLRDLESSEESKYNVWLQELEDIDRKSGFKPMSREEKVRVTVRSEFASTVSLYLEDWLEKLSLPGCNKSTLIRYMASQEPDDAITPRQKSDILNSHRPAQSTTPPGANRAAEMFTEAFHRVFHLGQSPTKQIELRDVLLLDESVDSIMDAKPTAKDGVNTQNEIEDETLDEYEATEFNLGSYCILGCIICFSHSCEHGEYDAQNCKRMISIFPRLSDTLKRKRRVQPNGNELVNGHTHGPRPCNRNCHQQLAPSATLEQRPWTDEERVVLRATMTTADCTQVKRDPLCFVAHLLERDCWEVAQEYERLHITLPPAEPANKPQIRTVSWYDRFKKALIGDWENHTDTHEHQRRDLSEPCSHEGPCTLESCTCVQHGLLCEKFCGCTVESCAYKFTGCACHSQGKTCLSKQKDRPCICIQLNRECDPDICGSCGALERADPENAEDEILHATGCQNCSLQRGLPKGLALGQSQLEGVGYGLFTAEFIAQDDFIIEYVGELITHDEGVRREARRGDVFDEESNISYVFTLLENEGIWVDAAIYGNLSRYINHASENDKRGCNITPRILYVNGEYRIKFTAMRDIEAGEELFFNYGENFPNLTKKLLDHKVGGKSDQAKKRARRTNRAEHGEGVARKAPKADKKKAAKGKKAARLALEDEDVMMADLANFSAKPARKRKRGIQDDSEEEEYHPTGTDATGSRAESPSSADSDFATSKAPGRLRKRSRHPKSASSEQVGKSRGEPKTRGKRGGARPGSGRPRKYPRTAPKPSAAPTPEQLVAASPEEAQIVVPEMTQPVVTARGLPRLEGPEIDDSLDDIDDSGELTYSLRQHELDAGEDEDEDDDDQDVVVRHRTSHQDRSGKRHRRPTAKSQEAGAWPSRSQ